MDIIRFLKAHYGYWHLPVSKEALLKLFGVENKKSYLMNTGMFKLKVLDVAVSEINELTELKILYKEENVGNPLLDLTHIGVMGQLSLAPLRNK